VHLVGEKHCLKTKFSFGLTLNPHNLFYEHKSIGAEQENNVTYSENDATYDRCT
jgi:hypothetical protein